MAGRTENELRLQELADQYRIPSQEHLNALIRLLGQFVQRARQRLNMSLEGLAIVSHWKTEALDQLEAGCLPYSELDQMHLRWLAKALGLSPEFLCNVVRLNFSHFRDETHRFPDNMADDD